MLIIIATVILVNTSDVVTFLILLNVWNHVSVSNCPLYKIIMGISKINCDPVLIYNKAMWLHYLLILSLMSAAAFV